MKTVVVDRLDWMRGYVGGACERHFYRPGAVCAIGKDWDDDAIVIDAKRRISHAGEANRPCFRNRQSLPRYNQSVPITPKILQKNFRLSLQKAM